MLKICKEKDCETRVTGRKKYCALHSSHAFHHRRYIIKLRKNPEKYARFLKLNRNSRKLRFSKNGQQLLEIQRSACASCNQRLKFRVLAHYGKNGQCLCKWRGCLVSDPDMLTIDHVSNDGKQHREAGYKGGVNGFRQLERDGYPDGFQTLCANHQLKKEILRRRYVIS